MVRRRHEIMAQMAEREDWISAHSERLVGTRSGRLELDALKMELDELREELGAAREHSPFYEGQRSRALHPELGRLVPITFMVVPEFVTMEGWVVRGALLGVCDETGDVVSVPAQSAAAFGLARRELEAAEAEGA